MGIEVIGISKDSVKSHANFAAKQELPFILLADPERQAIEAYDVWQEKKLYGKVSMGHEKIFFIFCMIVTLSLFFKASLSTITIS